LIFSLVGFVLLYSLFICVEMYLMFKLARKGPETEKDAANPPAGRSRGSLGLA
jgi:cytochrome d ubiquinol oxidase subunit I